MKKTVLVIALAIASLNTAYAQEQAPAADPLRFVVGGGFTYGGDELSSVEYTDGTVATIRAGSGLVLFGGVDYRVNEWFSFAGTAGIHIDENAAKNGNMRLTRYPLEVMAYVHPMNNFRIGGGVRYITGAKFTSKGAAYRGNYKFDGAPAGVIEGEYLSNARWGVKVRYVIEELKDAEPGYNYKYNANHWGVYGSFYF